MPDILARQLPNGYLRNGNLCPDEQVSAHDEGGGVGRPVIAEAIKKFESVYALYRSDERRGIPMSVRERHEKALAEIRRQIRLAARNRGGKRLGELLLAEGVLDKGSLEQALAEQARQGSKKLLGEILIELGFVGPEAVRRAIEEQAAAEGPNSYVRP